MSMNISSSSGAGGLGGIPTSASMDTFSSALKGQSSGDLLNALGKPGMEPWKNDAIVKELENRLEKSQKPEEGGGAQGSGGPQGSGGSGGGDDDDIKKLLSKLMKGTISTHETEKLAGALGVDTDKLDAVKGGGSGGGGSSSGDSDIQGG